MKVIHCLISLSAYVQTSRIQVDIIISDIFFTLVLCFRTQTDQWVPQVKRSQRQTGSSAEPSKLLEGDNSGSKVLTIRCQQFGYVNFNTMTLRCQDSASPVNVRVFQEFRLVSFFPTTTLFLCYSKGNQMWNNTRTDCLISACTIADVVSLFLC